MTPDFAIFMHELSGPNLKKPADSTIGLAIHN